MLPPCLSASIDALCWAVRRGGAVREPEARPRDHPQAAGPGGRGRAQ